MNETVHAGQDIIESWTERHIQSTLSPNAQQAYANFSISHDQRPFCYEGNIEKVKIKGNSIYRYICLKIGNHSFHSILKFDEDPFTRDELAPAERSILTTFDPSTLEGYLRFISKRKEEDYFIINYCFNSDRVTKDAQGRIKLNFDQFSQALKDFLTTEQRYFQMMGDS